MNIKLNKKITPQKALENIDNLISLYNKMIFLKAWENDRHMSQWQQALLKSINKLFKNSSEIVAKLEVYNIETFDLKKMVTPDNFNEGFKKRKQDNKKYLKLQKEKILEIKKEIQEKSKDSMEQNKKKINLPEKTSWEDITIKFLDLYEIEIHVKNKYINKYTYKYLGFAKQNTKNKEPNSQWRFLIQISTTKGKLDFDKHIKIEGRDKNTEKEKDKYKQYKKKLSDSLKNIFDLQEDPFHEYREKESYETRFVLLPPPDLRDYNEEPWGTKDKKREYLSPRDKP
jgi:hypothetical protein